MNRDFEPYFGEFARILLEHGYQLIENDDFFARFEKDERVVEFEGEPAVRPAATIYTRNNSKKSTGRRYIVRFIAEIFFRQNNQPAQPPSLSNLSNFIVTHEMYIFNIPEPFEPEYSRIFA